MAARAAARAAIGGAAGRPLEGLAAGILQRLGLQQALGVAPAVHPPTPSFQGGTDRGAAWRRSRAGGWAFFSTAPPNVPGRDLVVREFRLAQTGEGIKECELLRWHVAAGDAVDPFSRLCEVQSDKATLEITSPYGGVVRALRAAPGDVVQVGAVLAEIEAAPDGELAQDEVEAEGGNAEAPLNALVGGAEPLPGPAARPVEASPAVRRLAAEAGVDLAAVRGSGPGGRVLKADVLALARKGASGAAAEDAAAEDAAAPAADLAATPAPPPPRAASDVVVPLRGYRRAMVRAMTAAAAIPHFHYCDEVGMDALVALRDRLRGAPALRGAPLTFMPFFVKAAALALAAHPAVNSSLRADGASLLAHGAAHVGVAMATPAGLVVPVVRDAADRTVAGIAAELARLRAAAAAGAVRPADLGGATFTLSNIGAVGGTTAAPLVNPPEAAIMATGRVARLPRFDAAGAVVPAHVMPVSLGADHRVVDGAALAAFAAEWKRLVEDPGAMLLELR